MRWAGVNPCPPILCSENALKQAFLTPKSVTKNLVLFRTISTGLNEKGRGSLEKKGG